MQTGNTEYVKSYYAATANPAPERPPLEGDLTCDVCVVGGGFAGIATALSLAEQGHKVVVIEAAKIGWGASGRNAGQMVNGFSRDFDTIRKSHGETVARAFLDMSFEGADIIRERVNKYKIDCHLSNAGTFFAAVNKNQMEGLEREKEVWEEGGHDSLALYGKDKVRDFVGTDKYCGGLHDPRGGHIHPLNLVLGQAAALESLGGTIYEQTPMIKLERKPKPEVITNNGTITANFVVLCGGAYLGKTEPKLAKRTMPVSSKIITTEVLDKETCDKIIPSDVGIEDCNFVIEYYRMTGDNRLLFGGGIHYGRPDSPHIVQELFPQMTANFPFLKDVKIEFSWSCAMSFTFKRLPHIGRFGDSIYYIQGFSGHGVTTTHLIGRLMAEAITQQSSRLDVFTNIKHYPFPGGRMLRVPLTAIGAWYYDLRDKTGL